MSYTYSQYCAQCLLLPLVIGAAMICAAVFGVMKAFRQVRTMGAAEGLLHLAGILLLISLAAMQIGVLKEGGIYLLTERENDALTVSGRIEKVEALTERQFYNKYGEAASFQINGERFSIFSMGDVKTGDEVETTYLPKSRYVLRIEKLDNHETD